MFSAEDPRVAAPARGRWSFCLTLLLSGCTAVAAPGSEDAGGGPSGRDTDSRGRDTDREQPDSGTDLTPVDSALPDLTPADSAPADLTPMDAARPDLTPWDSAPTDFWPVDARIEDTEACLTVSQEAENVTRPVDIVWIIDTSGSMDEETSLVEEKIRDFSNFLAGASMDYRVILIAAETVCFPNPPSGGGCPDTDSPTYHHTRRVVDSHNALELIVGTYTDYQSFLRPDAAKHFVVVTDDESDLQSSRFLTQIAALATPGFGVAGTDWVFHTIASLTENCILGGLICTGCSGSRGDAEAQGSQYMALSAFTDGVQQSICETNWDPIFEGIGERVVDTARLPCTYAIPDPGEGMEVMWDDVTVYYTPPGGAPVDLPHVDGASSCGSTRGWYFDNPAAPVNIQLCPAACSDGEGEIEIELGCVKA